MVTVLPQDQHVGDVMEQDDPVKDWDMNFPQEISGLRNKYGCIMWAILKYCQTSRNVSVFTHSG